MAGKSKKSKAARVSKKSNLDLAEAIRGSLDELHRGLKHKDGAVRLDTALRILTGLGVLKGPADV